MDLVSKTCTKPIPETAVYDEIHAMNTGAVKGPPSTKIKLDRMVNVKIPGKMDVATATRQQGTVTRAGLWAPPRHPFQSISQKQSSSPRATICPQF